MFTSIFGLPVKYEAWGKENTLPLYITGSYDFHTVYIANKRCIMLTPTEELPTLPALRKQIAKIQETEYVPVILDLRELSRYRRKSLLENLIPFVTEKQAFLPFVGAMLMEEKKPEKLKEKFAGSTQVLFLFYLHSKQKKLYISKAGKVLPFSAMTMSRAVKQLEATGLFAVSKDGVHTVMEAKYRRRELFEKARQYLCSPVRHAGYLEKTALTENMIFAGETALAEQSMLNPGRVVTCAIAEKGFNKKMLTNELIDPQKQIRLELWVYDPGIFAKNNVADGLSVALSFGGNEDERIDEAVEEIIERELQE